MRIFLLWAAMLIVLAGPSRATVISLSSALFDYMVSASDVVGSGYIRFYGPTNQDYSAIFTGWAITGPRGDDPLSDAGYPAYNSFESLNLGGAKGPGIVEPTLFAPAGDAYILQLNYVGNAVCIGDQNNPICADPGIDVPITLSTTFPSGPGSQDR
jgi:hypothetical protein